MARVNPEIERLQRENAMLRRAMDRLSEPPDPYPVDGCGDTSCMVAPPRGMSTNGGCRCDERTLRWALRWYKRYVEYQRACIEEMTLDVKRARLELEEFKRASAEHEPTKKCPLCKGNGHCFGVDAIEADGRPVNPRPETCMVCDGAGKVPT